MTQQKKTQQKSKDSAAAKKLKQVENRRKELKETSEHKDVYSIIVPKDKDGNDYYVAYIGKPSRATLSASMAQMDTDPLGANETILRSCWIEGDDEIVDDDDVFMGAVNSLQNLLEVRQGFLLKG